MSKLQPRYKVLRAGKHFELDGNWEKPAWDRAPTLVLSNWMGKLPTHRPVTSAKLLYDDDFLYVIFHVEDKYVRSVVTEYQGQVCTDSCVEFFFTPGRKLTDGYFNLETNCGGTILFMHQLERGVGCRFVNSDFGGTLTVAHTMSRIVDPEIENPVTWSVEYKIAYAALAAYAPVRKPFPGVIWRANFYKCGDATSHPHWLTWAKVDWPEPNFHLKEFFGELEFGDS